MTDGMNSGMLIKLNLFLMPQIKSFATINGIAEGKPASERKILNDFFLSFYVSLLLQAATAAAAQQQFSVCEWHVLGNWQIIIKTDKLLLRKKYTICARFRSNCGFFWLQHR